MTDITTMRAVYIERHIDGYCLVDNANPMRVVSEGTPPLSSTRYFTTKAKAKKFAADNKVRVIL